MAEYGRLCGKNSPTEQFFVQLAKMAAIEHPHELRFQETFNGIASHVHGATPADRIQESEGIIHAMLARLSLFAHPVEQVSHGENTVCRSDVFRIIAR